MPIDFFKQDCKTTSNIQEFGLCDDPPPPHLPAYIDEDDTNKWIGIVKNPTSKKVDFYAIDHCVSILCADGEEESKCDGMLHYENNLVFVELKNRGGSGWLKGAREQLESTIKEFNKSNSFTDYTIVEMYACNSLKPLVKESTSTQFQIFKDNTGFEMKAQRIINI